MEEGDAPGETRKPSPATEPLAKRPRDVEDGKRIVSNELTRSITRAMPTIDFVARLAPSKIRFLTDAQSITAMLLKTESIRSMDSISKGLEGILGSGKLPSIWPDFPLSRSPVNSLNLPSTTSLWAHMFLAPGFIESLGARLSFPTWVNQPPAQSLIDSLMPSFKPLIDARPALLDLLGGLDVSYLSNLGWITRLTKGLKLSRSHLPANWRDVALDPDDLEHEVREILEEGIPLAWVPSGRVIELLLAAPDAPSRRRVITSNYRGILTGCDNLVGSLASKRALIYVDMIRKSIQALRDGHVEAAQSLATNILDTLVNQHSRDALGVTAGAVTNTSSYAMFRKKGWRLTLAVHPVTTIMSGRFTLRDRPGGYRRNATAHAITRHQYNRINAVLAITNATSLVTCFVRDTPAFD